MRKQRVILPIIALMIANILWGGDTVFIKMGVASIPVTIFMAIRFLTAALVLLPFAIRSWKPLTTKSFLLLSLSSIFYVSLSSLALYIGLTKTSASNSAIIYLLEPLILLVLSASFLKERLSIRTFVGICIALIGSLIIIGRPWMSSGSGSEVVGNLLIVIAVFCVAISILICKPLTKRVSTEQLVFLYMLPGILPIAIYALKQLGSWSVASTTASSWVGLIGSTLAVIFADLLFFFALNNKKAMDTGVYQYLESVTTIVVAWVLLAERPSPKFIIGAVFVFLGVYLAEFYKLRVKV